MKTSFYSSIAITLSFSLFASANGVERIEKEVSTLERCAGFDQHHLEDVEKLVFYAIDKASNYDLCASENTDTLEKIGEIPLASMNIGNGDTYMWMIINATLSSNGYDAVGTNEIRKMVSSGAKIDTPDDILMLVESKLKQN